jgi:protein-disulfide isomerase
MTRDVKAREWVETAPAVHYNVRVSTARFLGHFIVALIAISACGNKSQQPDTGSSLPIEHNGGTNTNPGPSTPVVSDNSPLQGIDTSKLDEDRLKLFYKLVASLKSPCGKPQSLRASFTSDSSCKRAPFAVKYLLALLEDEFPEDKAVDEWQKKYEHVGKPIKLDVSKAPRVGNDDAPVRLVEFYDYGCPHCYEFRAIMDKVLEEHAGKVVTYYMMFPLGSWPNSKSAGQAAIAAFKQGKFKQMHELLFEKSVSNPGQNKPHTEADVIGYAKDMGMDVGKFTADYKAAAPQVESDKAQGEAAGVNSTPTIFFNDRPYDAKVHLPLQAKYLGMWIEEEVAVNR